MPTPPSYKTDLHLAIDQGGHASRALVFDGAGCRVAQAMRPVGVARPQPEWVEQDPEEVVSSVFDVVGAALEQLGTRAAAVVNAGLATQRSSIVCWDRRDGAPLSPVISWQDRRMHAWLTRFAPQADAIRKVTGLQLSPHYGASKLRWCLDNLPAVRAAQRGGYLACGPLAAFLVFRLTREHALLVDPANAARTLLWNLKTLAWDPWLLDLFGIPAGALPACVATRHAYGMLHLPAHVIPLEIVSGDQSAALFSDGQPYADVAYINVGTGAFVQRTCGHYPGHTRRLLSGVVLQDGGELTYVLEGTVNGAGSALAWWQEQAGLADIEQQMPQWLQRTEEPALFINGVSGVGSPYWAPQLASRFIGPGEPWQQAVAVMESIVFLLQANLEEFGQLSSPFESLRVSGGLTAYDGLCRRLADLSGLPVYRPQVVEATARGTAWLLAGNPASWPESELGVWFKPAVNVALRARYARWKQAMEQALSS
jgi:glycerol kinase